MKKLIIICGVVCLNLGLYAGGDANTCVSQSIGIDSPLCKPDKVYNQRNAQLMWQDQSYTEAETGAYKRNNSVGKAGSWNYAKDYCMALDYQGHSDWRLPTSDELQNVHREQGQVFTYYRTDNFWTSTPATENRYYVVFPVDAYQYKRSKKESNYIRCVRCNVAVKRGSLLRVISDTVNNISERN